MNHYIPNVASLARVFQNKFTKLRYDIEEFAAVSYQSVSITFGQSANMAF